MTEHSTAGAVRVAPLTPAPEAAVPAAATPGTVEPESPSPVPAAPVAAAPGTAEPESPSPAPAAPAAWSATTSRTTTAAPQDLGMATAEYAITTLAACGFAGLLLVLLRGGEVRGLLLGLVRRALSVD